MKILAIETSPTDNIIPKFSDIKEPKSATDMISIVAIAFLPLCVWAVRGAISSRWERAKANHDLELEEQKIELAQRDSLIKHLQDQNSKLINEIFILRRTMDYSGDFTPNRVPKKKVQ